MKYPAFWKALAPYQRPTRYMKLHPGETGQLPITKIGGVPWWPAGLPRPHCPKGHAMSFLLQIRLCDVPALGPNDPGLLSFHYCQECVYEGSVSFPGYQSDTWVWDEAAYDLRVFMDWTQLPVDGSGVIAEDVLRPHAVNLVERLETPCMKDIYELSEVYSLLPEDWYEDEDGEFDCITSDAGIDEHEFPSFVHWPDSKIGGWPTWQNPSEWPEDEDGKRLIFAGQIDWRLGEHSAWGGGGYAYIFVNRPDAPQRLARWVLQDT